MDNEKKKIDTISDLSVEGVLDEINAEGLNFDTGELDIEDILAEFSDSSQKKQEEKAALARQKP